MPVDLEKTIDISFLKSALSCAKEKTECVYFMRSKRNVREHIEDHCAKAYLPKSSNGTHTRIMNLPSIEAEYPN